MHAVSVTRGSLKTLVAVATLALVLLACSLGRSAPAADIALWISDSLPWAEWIEKPVPNWMAHCRRVGRISVPTDPVAAYFGCAIRAVVVVFLASGTVSSSCSCRFCPMIECKPPKYLVAADHRRRMWYPLLLPIPYERKPSPIFLQLVSAADV